MKRTLVLLLVAMTTSLQGFAIVRSQQVMKEIANRQLQQMGINGMVTLATETNTLPSIVVPCRDLSSWEKQAKAERC